MAAIRHVGIIGGGLAGLAAALSATRAGLRVELFEAQAEPAYPPAHLDVVPNLLRDLATLGLAGACVRRGFPYQGFQVLDGDGVTQFAVPTPRLAGAPWPGALGLVYGELLAALREAVLAAGGVLHLGHAVRDANDDGAIVTERGSRHAVDLAVIASGDRLPTVAGRPLAALDEEVLQQQWCHALVPRPQGLECATWVIGRGGLRAMLVPVDTRRIGVALLQPADAAATPAALRAVLAGDGRLLQGLARHFGDEVPVLRRPVRSGVLSAPWHQAGVLRIGLSVHRLPPHFGQAAAQTLEDACVLGALLRDGLSKEALPAAFMARRYERARQVHAVAAQAARWQLHPEPGTDLRALHERLVPLVAEPA